MTDRTDVALALAGTGLLAMALGRVVARRRDQERGREQHATAEPVTVEID
jgi:hypothetical protein